MESYVFYCPNCKQTMAGEYAPLAELDCPECGKNLIPTGYTREEWIEKSQREKDTILEDLDRRPPEEPPKSEKKDTADTMPPTPVANIFTFVEERCPAVVVVRFLLFLLMGLGALLTFIGFSTPELLIVGPSVIGAAIVIFMDLYLACWFYKAAVLKGHEDTAYFWISFIFTLPGYLLIACLPDRGNPKE